jgi:transposase
MPRYSTERKLAVLEKLLPPHNFSVNQIAEQEGISVTALSLGRRQACAPYGKGQHSYNWRKTARMEGKPVPGSRNPTPEDWPAEAKFAVVMETASLNEAELAEYCRAKGLYAEQIGRWKTAAYEGLSQPKKTPPSQLNHREIRKLKRQLARKDKALAEAAALLILQKKFQALWEDEDN